MQELTEGTKQFLADLQAYAGHQLNFPLEVGRLLDLANSGNLGQVFRDAIFHAKFAVKSKEIIGRIGTEGEGYGKLSEEFQNSIEKTSTLLKTIVKESSDDTKQHFVRNFFSLEQGSFSNLIRLLDDLAWVKNWEVDGKPVPLSGAQMVRSAGDNEFAGTHDSVKKSSILGLVLMVILLIVDPPVSYLGWVVAILICILLLYIAVASRKQK